MLSFWWNRDIQEVLTLCVCVCVCARACVCVYTCAQLCPTLCSSMDCSPPGSSVLWDLSDPGIEPPSPASPALAGWILYHWATWEACWLSMFIKCLHRGCSGLPWSWHNPCRCSSSVLDPSRDGAMLSTCGFLGPWLQTQEKHPSPHLPSLLVFVKIIIWD